LKIVFPPNPSDGEIFEAIPGLFFQYRASDNSWIRIDGSDALPIASPLQDGIMTSEDLHKIMSLIIPPPQATLKGEDCPLIFKHGKVGIYSSDESLVITPKLNLRKSSNDTPVPWDIHRNTVGIDFKLNIEQFLDEIKKRGNLIERKIQGDQGDVGDRGNAGRDKLDTGPTGATGSDGTNSPFEGSLIEESLDLTVGGSDEPRGIVDISTEQVSDDENYLVLTRANIGNPDACPSEIIPKPILSPWLLVVQRGTKSTKKLSKLTDDCGVSCATCSSSIYYLNAEPLLEQIFARFKEKIIELKEAKEDLVASWLKTMVFLFNQQKSALCCALENCKSRTRNTGARQYIEQQRIQAALGNFSLIVNGVEDRLTVDLDENKQCATPISQPSDYVKQNLSAGCGEWLYELTIDATVHNRDPRTSGNSHCLSFNLPRGSYYTQIIGCCATIGNEAVSKSFGEVATTQDGKITSVGKILVAGKAYPGAPVPGSPNEIIVHDEGGNQQKVQAIDVGAINSTPYANRKGYQAGSQHTGRVAMMYTRVIEQGTDRETYEPGVVQLPNMGLFADPSSASSAYLGMTARFTHAGGST
jgi:hypothetical protein